MRKLCCLFALVVLAVPLLVYAQAQGRVRGTVLDSKGKPIASAKAIITCPEVATYKKEAKADDRGVFSVLIVDATKMYLFHIEAPGYQPIEQVNKPLIGSQTLELSFTLMTVEEVQAEAQKQALEQPGIKELREGKDLLDSGKPAEARAKFLESVRVKPDLHLGWLELGILDLNDGKVDEALKNAEKCLSLQPTFAHCLALAANAAKSKGDTAAYDKYMAAYKLVNPTDPAVLFNEAAEKLNKGDDAGAKPLLEQALEINGEFAPALFELGMIHVRAGESTRAKELLLKLLTVAPDYKDAAMAKEMLNYL